MAIAKRKKYALNDLAVKKKIVFLEEPKDLENIGAVIRVSAAADVAGVIINGDVDVWQPGVIRGAAGLHWALPVINLSFENLVKNSSRPIIALDPTGQPINQTTVPINSILVFGTERHGISKALLSQSDKILRLPMKTGVSSLNLATSVAAALYSL